MIYTRFHGRTGNQMFQYALGRALAKRLCVGLVVDDRLAVARGEKSLNRIFNLHTVAPHQMPPSQQDRRLAYLLWRYGGTKPKYLREKGLGFDPAVLEAPDETYLHGYWQSAKYFAGAEDEIRRDFAFPAPQGRNADLAEQIASGPSVSLHLRRGDYVSNASHVICGQPYYDAALAALLPQLPHDPVIYVFSDDPDWARDNLRLPGQPVIVDHNGAEADFEDLRLMSLCQHNIIANSSFSWWGAWLNANPSKKVMAPAQWFGKAELSNPDILPPDWYKITS
ncbi:alpha-1,2-fucosyltransferase [Pseudooceanicola algae]|uniref:O-antigen biosynthesis glycosyltransferase WbnK n=1 Tax=Pseudooceanicola algae TaxID=1537215 RepID=A0A418SGH7_9RHOB|nr:alpha-1,2-fucosyltransferase [Pseudooceanicola algae]QPM91631.1 O-antigen biosynthesis glycosyltransferase WbnK [Pseudooceanicola algae]